MINEKLRQQYEFNRELLEIKKNSILEYNVLRSSRYRQCNNDGITSVHIYKKSIKILKKRTKQ